MECLMEELSKLPPVGMTSGLTPDRVSELLTTGPFEEVMEVIIDEGVAHKTCITGRLGDGADWEVTGGQQKGNKDSYFHSR